MEALSPCNMTDGSCRSKSKAKKAFPTSRSGDMPSECRNGAPQQCGIRPGPGVSLGASAGRVTRASWLHRQTASGKKKIVEEKFVEGKCEGYNTTKKDALLVWQKPLQ